MVMTDLELALHIENLKAFWSTPEFTTEMSKRIAAMETKFGEEERERNRLNHEHRHDLYDI